MSLEPVEEAALRKLVTYLSPADEDADILEKVDGLIDEWHAREKRLEDLEQRVPENSTKKAKIRSIVQYADNQRSDGQELVSVTPAEVQGATGVSERYAYKLCDGEEGLPDDRDWIFTRADAPRFGSAEYDHDKMTKGIVLDFAGVQSSGVPLIMINNAERSEGGSDTAQEGEL